MTSKTYPKNPLAQQFLRALPSPQERKLLSAFFDLGFFDRGVVDGKPGAYGATFRFPNPPEDQEETEFLDLMVSHAVQLGPQQLSYHIDFVLTWWHCCLSENRNTVQIAVEVDGHQFHERTKEQAARDRGRDRALVAGGFHVLRFSGAEVHANAARCAWEVLEVLDALREHALHIGTEARSCWDGKAQRSRRYTS